MKAVKKKPGRSQKLFPFILICAVLVAVTCIHPGAQRLVQSEQQWVDGTGIAYAQQGSDAAASAGAFLKASSVFLSPRCVNCHPMGDHPLRGDAGLPHRMNVKRGPEGMGKDGLWCSTCHQEGNLPGMGMPPGGPDWQLPPESMPMVFEKKLPHELCEHLKDPAQNGGRTPAEVVEHVQTAPLVLWGWDPGEGRTPVPMSHPEFVKLMTDWAQKGAACPE